jgi:hypothetical protein
MGGGTVALVGVTGEVLAMPVAGLLTDASFTVLTPRTRAPLPARGVLDGLPAEVAGRAAWGIAQHEGRRSRRERSAAGAQQSGAAQEVRG